MISFTVTDLLTIGGQKSITGLSNLTRISQGFDVTTLSQDVSAATDLVTAIDDYDSELVDVTGTVATFANSGAGFEKSVFTTTGITGAATFVLRVPATLRGLVDLVPTCTVTIKDTPVGRFGAETQLAASRRTTSRSPVARRRRWRARRSCLRPRFASRSRGTFSPVA